MYLNNPRCGELALGALDNGFQHKSLKGIGESSSNGKVTLLEHAKLGETLESHFATTDFFTRAPE